MKNEISETKDEIIILLFRLTAKSYLYIYYYIRIYYILYYIIKIKELKVNIVLDVYIV